jgi:hypothetical protein
VHLNIENNKFCEIKINHKVNHLFLHSCCCTIFCDDWFESKFKRHSKTFENVI